MEKKITMTSSLVDGLKVDIYLISDEAVEGELLAKGDEFEWAGNWKI